MARAREPRPCLVVINPDGAFDQVQPETCDEPSTLFAVDDRALYGHVCRACWQLFEPTEQVLYALESGEGGS